MPGPVRHDPELPVLRPDVGGDARRRVGHGARDVDLDLVADDVGAGRRHEGRDRREERPDRSNSRSCRSLSSASVQRTWRTATAASPMISAEGRLVGGRVAGHEHGHDPAARLVDVQAAGDRPGARRGTPGRPRRARPRRSARRSSSATSKGSSGTPQSVDRVRVRGHGLDPGEVGAQAHLLAEGDGVHEIGSRRGVGRRRRARDRRGRIGHGRRAGRAGAPEHEGWSAARARWPGRHGSMSCDGDARRAARVPCCPVSPLRCGHDRRARRGHRRRPAAAWRVGRRHIPGRPHPEPRHGRPRPALRLRLRAHGRTTTAVPGRPAPRGASSACRCGPSTATASRSTSRSTTPSSWPPTTGSPEPQRIFLPAVIARVVRNTLTFRPEHGFERLAGNHVIVRSGDVFAAFAHLATGSVRVTPGQAPRARRRHRARGPHRQLDGAAPPRPAHGRAGSADRPGAALRVPGLRGRARRALGAGRARHPRPGRAHPLRGREVSPR